jgi:1-acyl-sn-glycerol-3-phosphate acyltransferase
LVRALFTVEVRGLDNLPRSSDGKRGGGWIASGLPHRNWLEPMLLFALLPARPRHVSVADAATINRSLLRRNLVRLAGGAILVGQKDGRGGFERIAREASEATAKGRVVVIFPETGPPSRPPDLRRLSPGVAHLAARSRAPVCLVVFGGTQELYLRRRIVMSLLPAVAPPVDTTRTAIAAFMADFQARARAAALEVHESAESVAPRRKVGRWLTGRYPQADD